MNDNEAISILNGLVEACGRAERLFRGAAEDIRNSEFRRIFNIFAQQRTQFISELQAETHRLGGDVGTIGSHAAGEPLTTIPLGRSSAQADIRDEAAVIVECKREEEASVNDYQEALKADLPLDVQYVVKRQYMDIKDAYDRIRILQRAA